MKTKDLRPPDLDAKWTPNVSFAAVWTPFRLQKRSVKEPTGLD